MNSIRCARCGKILSLDELDKRHCGKCQAEAKKEKKNEGVIEGPRLASPILLLVCPNCSKEALGYDEKFRVFTCLNNLCGKSYALIEYDTKYLEEALGG